MLYVLQLQQNRIFVYCNISVICDSLEDIKRECEFLYDFTKTYPIESMIEVKPNTIYDQTNQAVKQYMILHGVDYVRGGSYSDITLSKEQVAFITAELAYNMHITKCEVVLELYNEILAAPCDKQEEIKDSWSRYNALKDHYNGLITISPTCSLDCKWLYDELEWMKDCLMQQLIGIPDGSYVPDFQRYMTVIPYIKRLPLIADAIRINNNSPPFDFPKIFRPLRNTAETKENWVYKNEETNDDETKDDETKDEDRPLFEYDYDAEGSEQADFNIFINNPQFIFDDYFVNRKWSLNLHKSKSPKFKSPKFILHVFGIILYFANYIRNYLAELEHGIERFDFVTAMKYKQIPPTVWCDIYDDFISKYWNMANA